MRIAINIAIILLAISLPASINAQNIGSLPGRTADSSRFKSEFIIIKGDEIRRFPSPNFMDAVNGLFPWVFSPVIDQNDYLFVVNGFILADINSISLNDIEEIIFTRANLVGNLYHFSKGGTFLITTRTPKNEKVLINVSSQYNQSWNKDKTIPPYMVGFNFPPNSAPTQQNNQSGHYLCEYVSLSWAIKKFKLYFSAEMDDQKFPAIKQSTIYPLIPTTNDSVNATLKSKYASQRLYLNLSYKFSNKVDVGITADYSHGRFERNLDYSHFYGDKSYVSNNLKVPIAYYHAGAYFNYRILKNLSNTLWFEYLYEKPESGYSSVNNYTVNGTPSQQSLSNNADLRNSKYVIRDELKYDLSAGKDFTSSLSVTALYFRRKANDTIYSRSFQNGMLVGGSSSWYSFREKIASLNPLFNFSYRQLVSGYIGSAFLIGNKIFKDIEKKDKIGFYTGGEFNATPLLKSTKALSFLSLSSAYSDLPKNNTRDYWLNQRYLYTTPGPFSIFETSGAGINIPKLSIARAKLFSVTLNAGFLNNRIQFIADWSRIKTERIYSVYVGFPPGQFYYIKGIETVKGVSFAFSGKLIDKKEVKFRSGFNLFFPEISVDPSVATSPVNLYESTMRAGWQNHLEYKRFFLQANAMFDIGRKYVADVLQQTTVRKNELSLNYLMLGYHPAISKSLPFSDLSVFVQARNLFASEALKKNYDYDQYAGAGVNFSF